MANDRAVGAGSGADREGGSVSEMLRIDLVEAPDTADRQAIARWVRESAVARVGPTGYAHFALVLREQEGGEPLGGALVEVLLGWLYVELLGVPEDIRGQRIGSRLLAEIEVQARARGCNGIWLNCFSFHAPDFYRKNGFEQFAQLDDHPPGHTNFFFKKQWPVVAPDA